MGCFSGSYKRPQDRDQIKVILLWQIAINMVISMIDWLTCDAGTRNRDHALFVEINSHPVPIERTLPHPVIVIIHCFILFDNFESRPPCFDSVLPGAEKCQTVRSTIVINPEHYKQNVSRSENIRWFVCLFVGLPFRPPSACLVPLSLNAKSYVPVWFVAEASTPAIRCKFGAEHTAVRGLERCCSAADVLFKQTHYRYRPLPSRTITNFRRVIIREKV